MGSFLLCFYYAATIRIGAGCQVYGVTRAIKPSFNDHHVPYNSKFSWSKDFIDFGKVYT